MLVHVAIVTPIATRKLRHPPSGHQVGCLKAWLNSRTLTIVEPGPLKTVALPASSQSNISTSIYSKPVDSKTASTGPVIADNPNDPEGFTLCIKNGDIIVVDGPSLAFINKPNMSNIFFEFGPKMPARIEIDISTHQAIDDLYWSIQHLRCHSFLLQSVKRALHVECLQMLDLSSRGYQAIHRSSRTLVLRLILL